MFDYLVWKQISPTLVLPTQTCTGQKTQLFKLCGFYLLTVSCMRVTCYR